jgi:6-hydroxynicotinate 3-monooxygenase
VFPAELLCTSTIADLTKWWGEDQHILAYYTTGTRHEVNLVTSVPQAEWNHSGSFIDCSREEFLAHFDGCHQELRMIVESAPGITKWPVFERRTFPSVWSNGRITLLGDACHAMRPYMASGAAMAIEDAAVLARCIADIEDVEDGCSWYEANRIPRVIKVREISAANTWLRTPVDPDWLFSYDAMNESLFAPSTVH